MKQINIHSNPEYETPNKKICKSIIDYILNIEQIISYPNFLNNLGTCFYMLHKFSEAEKYFKRGLEIDNKHLHILNNLGNLKRET